VHELPGDVVIDGPQGHDDAVRPGDAECSLEAEDAFAVVQFAIAGVAG